MGASSSKTVVETKVVNEITKEALSKQVSSMAQQVVAVQNMNLSGIDAKCAFEATQPLLQAEEVLLLQDNEEKSIFHYQFTYIISIVNLSLLLEIAVFSFL